MRPRLLDLFCAAGGCSVGYQRAGFDVIGVDHRPMPRYPFGFCQGDALELLRCLMSNGYFRTSASDKAIYLEDIAAIHASPPCQQFSVAKRLNPKCNHEDLVSATRDLLEASGKKWVIENVPGSPLINPVLVCGLALGLNLKRHRLFESNSFLFGTTCPKGHRGEWLTIYGHDGTIRHERKKWVTVFGGGAPKVADNRRRASMDQRKEAMGIDWMTRDEMSLAIPPAYCQFIGKQLISALISSGRLPSDFSPEHTRGTSFFPDRKTDSRQSKGALLDSQFCERSGPEVLPENDENSHQ